MRHGARLDSADPNWAHNTPEGRSTPYDTPLTEPGKQEAFGIATKRYKNLVKVNSLHVVHRDDNAVRVDETTLVLESASLC